MKNFGLKSIAVLALLGQIDSATAIEMNKSEQAVVTDVKMQANISTQPG